MKFAFVASLGMKGLFFFFSHILSILELTAKLSGQSEPAVTVAARFEEL